MTELELPTMIRTALAELKQQLGALYGDRFRAIYLYGSYARGAATRNSDLDILLVLDGPVKPGAEITRVSAITSEIGLHYDLLISTLPISADWLETYHTSFLLNVRWEGVMV
ncbi:MAG: nucleotidyltransferase domain-containing protein [Anaerolineae bacterium]